MVPMSAALRDLLRDYWREAHPRDHLAERPDAPLAGPDRLANAASGWQLRALGTPLIRTEPVTHASA